MTVNIYRYHGEWCYAFFAGGEFDHSDPLNASSESEAIAEVSAMFEGAEVCRVADIL